MKNLLAILSAGVLLSGCQNLSPDQQKQLGDAGTWLAQQAFTLAQQYVISKATSTADRENKSDSIHGLAANLRTVEGTPVSGSKVALVAAASTPDKKHWKELAKKLGEIVEREGTGNVKKDAAIVEELAKGVQAAAQ